ncbi:MAG TPA: FtsQ-type POTRA domain-containing protein [Blastocatellia bacterium]|nr:FtsQ-type POTRA domain-containing protein [Blastocatellia bacterium]
MSIRKTLRAAMAFAKPAAMLAVLVLAIVGYNVMASSRLFQLRRVTVSDASPALRTDVEQAVRRMVGQNRLLDVDLAALRQKVEAVPRVRSATVARVLPDGIFVRVAEREPVVLVRRASESLIWLDEDAIEMGDFTDVNLDPKTGEAREIPPVAKGFAEGNRTQSAMAEDRERIAVFKLIEREFREGPNPLWNLIDQIDLTFTRDVNLRLAHPPVMVHVGSTDFRKRFEKALQVLRAIKQGDSELPGRFRVQDIERLIQNADNINFIDAARSERIVVNFATPGAQKAARQESRSSQSPKKN